MTDDDTTDRLDRLESLVERQAETIAALRDEVAELRHDEGAGRDAPVSRRTALRAGGLLALLGIGAGTASADPRGQVGTAADPLHALYALEANSPSSLSVSTGGQRVLDLDVPASDDAGNTAGGNVVAGHSTNVVEDGAAGVAIGGGGSDDPAGFNRVYDHYATVTGGEGNQAGSDDGDPSTATHAVVGGFGNVANGPWSVVSGGQLSQASGESATIGGGDGNTASGEESTVAGGQFNEASDTHATVGGGSGNTASALRATVSGGINNTASTHWATVGGGTSNVASAEGATVGGGDGNTASGNYATVPGGTRCVADGNYSLAAGYRADTNGHGGSVLFSAGTLDLTTAAAPNQFVVDAAGGIYLGDDNGPGGDFFTDESKLVDTSTGAHLTTGGTWTDSSSRTVKEGIEPVDGRAILDRVASLPVSEWSYEAEPDDVRHLGPMAEDFHATFGLGADDEHVASLDTAGVALAAIKGLLERVRRLEARLDSVAGPSEEETARA